MELSQLKSSDVAPYGKEPEMTPSGVNEQSINLSIIMSDQNSTNTSSHDRDENLAKVEITVQSLILFLAIFGNSLVLLILICRRKKLSRMNLMILHLALADLFVAFFNILPQLIWDVTYRFYGGDFLCRTVKYFQVVAMYASSYVLLTTAFDRYLVICYPLKTHQWTSARTQLMVFTAWAVSLLFSIPQCVIFSYQEVAPLSSVYDCWGNFQPEWTLQLYITWFTAAVYILPFLLLAFLYGNICLAVWRSMMSREPSTSHCTKHAAYQRVDVNGSPSGTPQRKVNPRAHVKTISRSKIKTVKLTLTVVLCYVICWGPFFVAQMWAAWDMNAPFTGDAMVIVLLLASLNSCTNPWIYMAFSDISGHVSRWCARRHHMSSFDERAASFDSEIRYQTSLLSKTENTRLCESRGSTVAFGNVIALTPMTNRKGPSYL